MNWRSNSFYSLATATIMVIAVAGLAHVTPPFGPLLLLCSAGPILLLAISAMHWSVRENNRPGFVVPTALGIVLIYGILLCVQTPEQPRTLTMDDLNTIHMGMRFEDIAREIGGGDWLSDAEAFTVAYAVEGDMKLVLVFEDGVHVSGAMLSQPDGIITALGDVER